MIASNQTKDTSRRRLIRSPGYRLLIACVLIITNIHACTVVNLVPGLTKPRLDCRVIDEFEALRDTFNQVEGKADINQYFDVLTHLKPETGYTLDYYYVLQEDFAGWPMLYSRPIQATPLPDIMNEPFTAEGDDSHIKTNWEEHIQVDDTDIGYFELVLLERLGDKFKLYWHADYEDMSLFCDISGLESALAEQCPGTSDDGDAIAV